MISEVEYVELSMPADLVTLVDRRVDEEVRKQEEQGRCCLVFGIKPLPLKTALPYQMPRLCWSQLPPAIPQRFQPERHTIERRQRGKDGGGAALQPESTRSRAGSTPKRSVRTYLTFRCLPQGPKDP